MSTPIYPPVWPEIAPWAVRLAATLDASLVPPPAPKSTWATEEVRMLEIQRLLSLQFSFVPTYEVLYDQRHVAILNNAIDVEHGCLGRADNLEHCQENLWKVARTHMYQAKVVNQRHGMVPRKVRSLTELCYMEVFRRLPEHRRLAATAQSNDPIRLLVLEASAEDQAKKQEEEKARKRSGPQSQMEEDPSIKRTRNN